MPFSTGTYFDAAVTDRLETEIHNMKQTTPAKLYILVNRSVYAPTIIDDISISDFKLSYILSFPPRWARRFVSHIFVYMSLWNISFRLKEIVLDLAMFQFELGNTFKTRFVYTIFHTLTEWYRNLHTHAQSFKIRYLINEYAYMKYLCACACFLSNKMWSNRIMLLTSFENTDRKITKFCSEWSLKSFYNDCTMK